MNSPDCLDWLADLMIPADDRLGLPSGSGVGLRDLLRASGSDRQLTEHADQVESAAQAHLGKSLEHLSIEEFQAFLKAVRAEIDPHLRAFGAELLKAYYTHPTVRDAIGAGSRAPFPQGFTVYAGNLELLEPVFERGPIFRNVNGGD